MNQKEAEDRVATIREECIMHYKHLGFVDVETEIDLWLNASGMKYFPRELESYLDRYEWKNNAVVLAKYFERGTRPLASYEFWRCWQSLTLHERLIWLLVDLEG